MREDRNLNLFDMQKLKEEFNILKEKIKNTLIEKQKLLQSKCEIGLKKVSDFINIHKSDVAVISKTAILASLICIVASFQFQLTMNEEIKKSESQFPIDKTVVMEATNYELANPSDVFKTNKDFFEALDETKNIVEEVQKLAKGISTVQKTREYNNSNSVVEKSSLEDKYQLISALAEKLKLNKKNKEKKELNKDRDFDKIDIESSSNRELDISIIEEIDEDKFFRIEKKDIDGDGIEDDVYIVDIGNGSKVPYKSVCYNRDDKVKDSKIEEYER